MLGSLKTAFAYVQVAAVPRSLWQRLEPVFIAFKDGPPEVLTPRDIDKRLDERLKYSAKLKFYTGAAHSQMLSLHEAYRPSISGERVPKKGLTKAAALQIHAHGPEHRYFSGTKECSCTVSKCVTAPSEEDDEL